MVVKDKNSDSFVTRTTLYDVTERKRVAEQLRLFSERLTLATRAASIGVWDWDLRTNQVYWDEKMFEIYGLPKLDPMPYEEWLQTDPSGGLAPGHGIPQVDCRQQRATAQLNSGLPGKTAHCATFREPNAWFSMKSRKPSAF